MQFRTLTKGLKIIGTNIAGERDFINVTDELENCSCNAPFICLKGEKYDGHSFALKAMERGAAVICERLPDGFKGDYLLLEKTRPADAIIQSNLHGNPERRLKVIGVTGTNGKTTVCHLLRTILEQSRHPCGLTGTVGSVVGGMPYESTMTTPKNRELYALMEESVLSGDEYFIIEASSHALEFDKFEPIIFTLSLFTNLSPEHLDFHGNMDNYKRAKAKLFQKSIMSLINADDKYGEYMYSNAACLRYRYSPLGLDYEFSAKDKTDNSEKGIEYFLLGENSGLKISSPMPGVFSFANTLCAASAALLLGVSPEDIYISLKGRGGVTGRLEKICGNDDGENDIDVYIDFAHTPEAMRSLLVSVRSFSGKRKITILFGCGGDRDRTKRPLMGAIAADGADRVIVTSDNPRSEEPVNIINDIMSGIKIGATVIENRTKAIEYAIESAEKDEIIIVAGKGHENYEIDRNGKHGYSERDIIKKSLIRRKSKNEGSDK